jgi:hypothetical protein
MQYCILQRDFNTATGETLNTLLIIRECLSKVLLTVPFKLKI